MKKAKEVSRTLTPEEARIFMQDAEQSLTVLYQITKKGGLR